MPKDPTRNIVRYKIGGSHLNEFEFHKHQGEMAEEFQAPGDEGRELGKRSQADRVAQLMAAAKRKAAKNRRRKAKASGAETNSEQKTKSAAPATARKRSAAKASVSKKSDRQKPRSRKATAR
ncbi:MAG TPA: hypothetical protein VJ124_13760 [Pyrinomonadaceae bacterium]|nr:hypothetical protein [Pyrinomonadaceae bacterium]